MAPTSGAHYSAPATGALVPLRANDRTPWLVAGLLTLITVVAVIYAATRQPAPAAPAMANAGNAVPGQDAGGSGLAGKVAPPIDQMTPKEQYLRLMARIDKAVATGDSTTVIDFTPMAMGAYANLPPGDRDIDARYRAALLEARVGMLPAARALADTIMKESPDNLLGYYVRAMIATFAGDSTGAKAARAAFRAHYDAEIKKPRIEYEANREFLQAYRKGDGAK